jgi:hypothetical protein
MNTITRNFLIIITIFLICSVIWFAAVSNTSSENKKNNQSLQNLSIIDTPAVQELPHIIRTNGPIAVNATIARNSSSLPVYHGKFDKNGSIDLQLKSFGSSRGNVTTEEDAPAVARKVMEAYGNLPDDAVFTGARTSYTEEYDHNLHKIVSIIPEDTTVTYSRNINGLWLIGDSNRIIITLGTDGELLWLFKVWRNYTYIGDTPLISVDEAIDKLEREDFISTTWHSGIRNVTIDTITPAYYAEDAGNSETLLEPVWLMMGNSDTGNRYRFTIYARKFAAFTASPTLIVRSEEIKFMDGSSSIRRIWDFGDGTNSTERNPLHGYQKPGNYSITLTAWNDLGSDVLVKSNYITVLASEKTKQPAEMQIGRK